MNETVYLLQQIDSNRVPTGFYRIAKTVNDVETRVRRLENEHATKFVPIHQLFVSDAQAAKTALYKHFENYKCKGLGSNEWLDLRKYSAEQIVSHFNQCFNVYRPQAQPQAQSQVRHYAQPQSRNYELEGFDLGDLPWGWIIGVVIFLGFLGSAATNQNATSSTAETRTYITGSKISLRPSDTVTIQNDRPGYKAAYLRSGQSDRSANLGTIKNGTRATVLQVGDGWTKVRTTLYPNGESATGWVFTEFVK